MRSGAGPDCQGDEQQVQGDERGRTGPLRSALLIGRGSMQDSSIHCLRIKRIVALVLISATVFAGSVFGQTPATRSNSDQKEVAASEPKPRTPDNKVAVEQPPPNDLQNEVSNLKAENAAVRELLRKMEEQQKTLLEHVERLQRRLDGPATAEVQPTTQPQPADTSVPVTTEGNAIAPPPPPIAKQDADNERYQDGIVIWETSEDAKVPFLLKFTNTTQVRYLNTLSANDMFTDHLGVVREVHKRNDITVNRSMFVFNGYIFDKRARYNLTVWTSAGAASIVVAGNIGWQFNKALTITGGYTCVPGSRSLVNTFPYYTATDRSMADNFFRPGFTLGVWATGELAKGLSYIGF